MLRHPSFPASTVDSEDSLVDISTAPTTPDGSFSFSPVLQALKLQDALEDAASGRGKQSSTSLNAAMQSSNNGGVKNICCVGAGYVGGPTAAVMAFQNPHIKVTVVDRDPKRIAQWKTKHLPIFEPGLDSILRIARDGSKQFGFYNEPSRPGSLDSMSNASSAESECESQCGEHRDEISIPARTPNLFFTTEVSKSISEADIVLIAVNTPTKMRGIGGGRATDVTALEAVTREIAIHAKPGAVLVEKSTVPCRTAEIIQDTLRVHRPHQTFEVLSNPEFLAAGTAINDLLVPDRVIIGSSPTPAGHRAAAILASVYAAWVPRERIVTMNVWSSELSKLVANSMLAQRISSINSISAICEKTGGDIDEVAKSIGMDPRIGDKFLKSGIGFGGSCFRKDILSLVYLAETLGLDEVAEYWTQVLTVNEWQRTRFVRRVVRCLNGTLVGKKLAVLGYAFKPSTDDTRESPALECIKMLLEDCPREISVFDPYCEPSVVRDEIRKLVGDHVLKENGGNIEVYADAYQACSDAHAVLIMTECDQFRTSPPSNSSPKLGGLPPKQVKPKKTPVDPRPFQRLEPTESEILALQKYLASAYSVQDPLQRFENEPACEEGCEKCEGEMSKTVVLDEKRDERLDWAKIAYHLQKPRWVFDGRNVVDGEVMHSLGVRVEGIGKVGWGGIGGR
ncbi:udp-glucose 6-dehydrogenase [Mollisia scopiformis]|uniref:UDP-glucose 6-dehydrogenase n=1 Tax=Mollisia scopiformis TaxID=149040 RepID=A0A194X8X6_MOLSC|nr:udp-glucose 6-dehydrogenase [Mollisia scopiformis]KUJ16623.1 udp-glucose 6-dehydrogenase [Mollisia scopiformis]